MSTDVRNGDFLGDDMCSMFGDGQRVRRWMDGRMEIKRGG